MASNNELFILAVAYLTAEAERETAERQSHEVWKAMERLLTKDRPKLSVIVGSKRITIAIEKSGMALRQEDVK
jgi:hypothetical protein